MTNNLKEQRRLFNFTVRFAWKAPEAQTPGKPAGAASAVAGK
jgi:type IV pilus assembly protein PilN